MFVNFEGMVIRSTEDIESVRRVFEALCSQIGRKSNVIVNYDGFRLDGRVAEACEEMVAALRA
jgi:propionate CoA-transferase